MKLIVATSSLLLLLTTQVLAHAARPWFIDARMKSSVNNIDLMSSANNSWHPVPGVSDGYLLVQEQSAPVRIGCGDNMQSTGLSCPGGRAAISINFIPPETTIYDVCVTASFETGVGGPNGGHWIESLQLVRTGNADQFPIDLDGPVAEFAPNRAAVGDAKTMHEQVVTTCRAFDLPAGRPVTLRLFERNKMSQSVFFAEILLGGAYENNPDNSVHWTVRRIR